MFSSFSLPPVNSSPNNTSLIEIPPLIDLVEKVQLRQNVLDLNLDR